MKEIYSCCGIDWDKKEANSFENNDGKHFHIKCPLIPNPMTHTNWREEEIDSFIIEDVTCVHHRSKEEIKERLNHIIEKIEKEAYLKGALAERQKIEARLKEYAEKGFDVNTAAYSACIPDLEDY